MISYKYQEFSGVAQIERVNLVLASVCELQFPTADLPALSHRVSAPKWKGDAQGQISRDQAWRRERVSVAAYYLAEKRGFRAGNDLYDWALAERQTDACDEVGY